MSTWEMIVLFACINVTIIIAGSVVKMVKDGKE